MLAGLGIEPHGPRSLTWHLPPELVETYIPNDRDILGYHVSEEMILGQNVIYLTETLAVGVVVEPEVEQELVH